MSPLNDPVHCLVVLAVMLAGIAGLIHVAKDAASWWRSRGR
jgi:hypothetical protein